MVENKSEIFLTKNNKLSLKMQKFSLRLNILLFFCNPSSVLKTRHFSSLWDKIYLKGEQNASVRLLASPDVLPLGQAKIN